MKSSKCEGGSSSIVFKHLQTGKREASLGQPQKPKDNHSKPQEKGPNWPALPAMTTTTTTNSQQEPQTMLCMKKSGTIESQCRPLLDEEKEEEEMTKSALAGFRAKEEEIERRRGEIRDRVQSQLDRVEEEAKRLLLIHGEIESLTDPMRKEVAVICKRVEPINREVKVLGVNCQKKEKEYKEAIEAFNEKNREKGQLIAKLVELVTESEKLRSKKLEELCKNI